MMMNHKKYSYKHSLAPFYLKKFNVNLFQFKKIKKIYNVNASFLHFKLTCLKKTATTIFQVTLMIHKVQTLGLRNQEN